MKNAFCPHYIPVIYRCLLLAGFITADGNSQYACARSAYIDSLKTVLISTTPPVSGGLSDSIRINTLITIAEEFFSFAPDSALAYSQQALKLSENARYQKGIAGSLDGIARFYWMTGEIKKSLEHVMRKLKIYEQTGHKKGISSSLSNIGVLYEELGEFSKALEYYFRALKMEEETAGTGEGTKKGTAIHLCNIGGVYYSQGDYPRALDYYFKALKLVMPAHDSIGKTHHISRHDQQKAATILSNIGMVYSDQGNLSSQKSVKNEFFNKALECYFKALKIHEALGNKNEIARHLGNIGIAYRNRENFELALEYYFKALKNDEEIGYKNGIARHLGNIGVVYWKQGIACSHGKTGKLLSQCNELFLHALEYYQKGLDVFEEIGDRKMVSSILGNIGALYTKVPNLPSPEGEDIMGLELAEKYLLRGVAIADSFRYQQVSMQINKSLSSLYDTLAELTPGLKHPLRKAHYYRMAYEHYKNYSNHKDSIFNEDKSREIGRLDARYEFDMQQAVADARHKADMEKQTALANAERKRQKIILYSVLGITLLLLIFGYFMFTRWKITRRQKKIIERQKKVVEEQKALVDQKNKDITDSIEYARRIQEALLTTGDYIEKYIQEYFIFYLPKDIISGDYYWGLEKDGKFYFAAADCTGHGVPGALMSMLGISFLNEIIIERSIQSPDRILNCLREEIINHLNPGRKQNIQDGMDMVICRFDLKEMILEFAGANRPLWIVRNGNLHEHPPDNMPIGAGGAELSFTLQKTTLQKGDQVFMFSDGFETQFGGPKNKKFMKKKLADLLLSVSKFPVQEQKERVTNAFNEWKGTGEQTDDVTVIGIKI